jgi:hypothetical protein
VGDEKPKREPPTVTVIAIRAVTDPLTRRGLPARPEIIRLRHVLKDIVRAEGFEVVECFDRKPDGTTADQPAAGARPPERVVKSVEVVVCCPKCKKPTDHLRRCWPCEDWVCACGKLTGSCLISRCLRCQVDAKARGEE